MSDYMARFVDLALRHFGIADARVQPVRLTNNAVFRLSAQSGEEFALRVHRPGYRSMEQIRSELNLVDALVRRGTVRVPQPVARPDGDFVATVEVDDQQRYCSVTTWIAGEVRRPGTGAGPRTLARIGEALGELHRFAETFRPPPGFVLPDWTVEHMFSDNAMRHVAEPPVRELLSDVAARVDEVFATLDRSPATRGVVHHDFILLNCLHEANRVGIIDFDDCGWGFYLQDLGGMLENLEGYDRSPVLTSQFLDGYRSVRALPSEQADHLDLMIALRHSIGVLWILERRDAGAIPPDRVQQILNHRLTQIGSYLDAG